MFRYLLSPIIGFVTFFILTLLSAATGIGVWPNGNVGHGAVTVASILGVISTVVSFKKLPQKRTVKESVTNSVKYVHDAKDEISSTIEDHDSKYYAIAEKEVIDDVINQGLWSKALVKAEGDESKRKVEYIKLRVKQLKRG